MHCNHVADAFWPAPTFSGAKGANADGKPCGELFFLVAGTSICAFRFQREQPGTGA